MYKNLIQSAEIINIKISHKKNRLTRKGNDFYFTLHYLGMESLMVVMEWLHEKERGLLSFNHTRKCGDGCNHSEPFHRDYITLEGLLLLRAS